MAVAPPRDMDGFEAAARRRLPRFAYDFIAGGAGRERALRRAREQLDDVCLLPRVLTGSEERSSACHVLGRDYAAPFAVAPTGLSNLAWPGADLALAGEAERFGIPYVISTPATSALERLAAAAPRSAWFQLYVGRDEAVALDLLDRAATAGIATLVVTADVPVPGKRLRDIRNGFGLPLSVTPRLLADLAAHPAWTLALLRAGGPRFANLERYAPPGSGVRSLARLMASQSSARFDWAGLDRIRARWPGALVLKGVLHPADGRRAVEAGVDAVVVSSHGGRQLDAAPAPVEMLGPVAAAVAGRAAILLDGGVRSGEDVARALALGAQMVLVGRGFLWAAAALGPRQGARAMTGLLHDELLAAMGQLGCRSVGELAHVEVVPGPAPGRVPQCFGEDRHD